MAGIYAKKILIVENDQTLSDQIVTVLTQLGHECFLSYDPEIVMAGFSQLKPDLVLLDISMSGVDGFSILKQIRELSDRTLAETPIMILSATGDMVEISHAIKFNIKDYFVKSRFDLAQIKEKISKFFSDNTVTSADVPNLERSQVQLKLLIVEDDKFLRDLATQKLSKEHLEVFAAVDGEQGIQLAEEKIPDIILLDILLPGIDGYEVLKRVRANPALQKTHVAMLSNFGQREDIERAFAAGADQFMVKANYTLDEIVEEVKKIMATPRKSASSPAS